MWNFDREYGNVVIGVDEAGRGPLAGPVVAGAVFIPKYFEELEEINDSKKLSEKKREKLFEIINEKCIVGVGIVDEKTIDEINILNATFLAMRKALEKVENKLEGKKINIVLVDGNHKIREYEKNQEAIIKGDAKSMSIAAASIIAKVTRDKILVNIAKEYPQYLFEKHKGYGTKLHREIINEKGICKYHRKSFLKKIINENHENSEGKGKEKIEELKLF